jgi:translation initiation factor IF-3
LPIGKKSDLRINERIRVPQVRVIDQENNQVGIIDTLEALDMANLAGLDLVEVAPTSKPPVCRIMDYGKWKYDQQKKEHKAKQKQHNIVLKEIRLRPKIETHDKETKLNKARKFLEKGSKVQFTMMFRGREMVHLDLAENLMDEIVEELQEIAKIEMPARRQGRRMTMVLAPAAHAPAGKESPKPKADEKAHE